MPGPLCRRTTLPAAIGWFAAAGALPNAAVAQQPPEGADAVDEIVVTGRARALYRVGELSSGKLPTEPLLSTQTIQVINAQLIGDQGARSAQDLYRNLSGVTFFSYAGVTARGFRQEENFYDGLRGDPYAGFSVPQLFNIERVELLKGPAGMLYGPGTPGGLFNYITRKPTDEFAAEASVIAGGRHRLGGAVQVSGPLSARVSARAGAFHEQMDQPRHNADSEITIYDSGASFDIGTAKLVLQATRYEQDLGGNRLRGVPVDDSGRFIASRRWNHNEVRDFLRLESSVVQATLNWLPTDSLAFDAGLRWNEGEEKQQYHEPFGLFDTTGDGLPDTSARQFRDQIRNSDSWSFGANAIWSGRAGIVDNRVLAGVDRFRETSRFDGRSVTGGTTAQPGLPTPLNLHAPAYGVTDVAGYTLPDFSTTRSQQDRSGVYLLNEATVDRVVGVVGVRRDRFEDRNLITDERFDDAASSWRAGLVYRLTDEVSLFAHWAQSFEPQGIGNQDPRRGGPFEPSRGRIHELGVRTALLGGRVQSSASVYRIVRNNILQADPRGDVDGDGFDDLIALGEVTSEGVEIDFTADVTPDWVATVSYGYNDARITGTAGTTAIINSVGDRFANAPRHQAGFWTRYQFPALNVAVALGGDYVSERVSLSGQRVRPYAVFDASLIYEIRSWRALLRLDNLLDSTYAASGFSDRTGHFPGEPRSFFVELTRRW